MANTNLRTFPKGIKQIPTNNNDVTLRFTGDDYTGYITLKDSDGEWDFNPTLKASVIGDLVTTIESTVEDSVATGITNAITDGTIINFQEAPVDGSLYARRNADWSTITVPTGAITNEIVSTVNVGGIVIGSTFAEGTTFESLFTSILTPYVSPILNTFTIGLTPSATSYEVGAPITIGAATFTYTNDSDGNPPVSFYVTGTGFNKSGTVSPITSSGETYQYTSASTSTWTITGTDENSNNINTLTFSRSAYWRAFFGAYTSATIASMQQSKLNSVAATSWTCTSANQNSIYYTYIIYPSIFADLSSIILNGASQVLGAFTKQSDISYTNAYSMTQTYKVYKSNALGAFASGDILSIS